MTDLTVTGGRDLSGGGGINNSNGGTLTPQSTRVVGNSAGDSFFGGGGGGGVRNVGTATLINSTVSRNEAADDDYPEGGGGVLNLAELTIVNSTISENTVFTSAYDYSSGGGLRNGFNANATIVNSTISGNEVKPLYFVSQPGAGISNSGYLTLQNSTVSGNDDQGGLWIDDGTVILSDTIVADKRRVRLSSGNGGSLIDGGGNFDHDGTCGAAATIVPGVDFDTTLADNGGPTETHALLSGSVAIDAAGACGLTTDQRGFLRFDGACDSGSFEFGSQLMPLVIDGICPGEMTVSVFGASPDGPVVIVSSDTEGAFVKPLPPCSGILLGLEQPSLVTTVSADGNGEILLTPEIRGPMCDLYLQVVDRTTCSDQQCRGVRAVLCANARPYRDGCGSRGDADQLRRVSPRHVPPGRGDRPSRGAGYRLGSRELEWDGRRFENGSHQSSDDA